MLTAIYQLVREVANILGCYKSASERSKPIYLAAIYQLVREVKPIYWAAIIAS